MGNELKSVLRTTTALNSVGSREGAMEILIYFFLLRSIPREDEISCPSLFSCWTTEANIMNFSLSRKAFTKETLPYTLLFTYRIMMHVHTL